MGVGDQEILINHDDLDIEKIQVEADLPSYGDAVAATGQLHIGGPSGKGLYEKFYF